MSKPWDKLRRPAVEVHPIGVGEWSTTESGAHVTLTDAGEDETGKYAGLALGARRQGFYVEDLRELSAFCTELADQLEGK